MKSLLHSTDDVEGTVAQSPLKMGDRVMEVIQDITAEGRATKREITIPVQMMTKENIRSIWCKWVAVMRKFRGVRYSLAILMVVNFIAVMLNSIIYLQATNYIIAQRQASYYWSVWAHSFCAFYNFLVVCALICWDCLDLQWVVTRSQTSRWSIFDKWNILEILPMLLLMWVQM